MSINRIHSTTPVTQIARSPIPDEQKIIQAPIEALVGAAQLCLPAGTRVEIGEEFSAYLGQPQYPVLVGNRLIDYLCRTYLPDHPMPEARRLLGQAYMRQYRSTLIGDLATSLGQLVPIDKALPSVPENYATLTNFGIYSVACLGPGHWRFDFEDDPGYPDFILGTLIEGGMMIGIPGLEITYRVLGPRHISFDIQWSVQQAEGVVKLHSSKPAA